MVTCILYFSDDDVTVGVDVVDDATVDVDVDDATVEVFVVGDATVEVFVVGDATVGLADVVVIFVKDELKTQTG